MRLEGSGKEPNCAPLWDALDWLARHQDRFGGWALECVCQDAGPEAYRIALTGLAVTAFLRSGHGPAGSKFSAVVRRALDTLVQMQSANGRLTRSGEPIENHHLATLALCEAARFVRSPVLIDAARRAVEYWRRLRPILPWYGWIAESAFEARLCVRIEAQALDFPKLDTSELLLLQRSESAGCARGSWDPAPSEGGGRVASTVAAALHLAAAGEPFVAPAR